MKIFINGIVQKLYKFVRLMWCIRIYIYFILVQCALIILFRNDSFEELMITQFLSLKSFIVIIFLFILVAPLFKSIKFGNLSISSKMDNVAAALDLAEWKSHSQPEGGGNVQ